MAAVRTGTDNWSLFLRQRRLQDQLRRLRNDFKNCYCPQGCRGGPHNHVGVDPATLPAQPLHGPYVDPESDMPITRARTDERRHSDCIVMAEARGTSDIVLYRRGTRATLRMSLQVHNDITDGNRVGYYAELFLTQHGHEEEFIGFINSWHVTRTNVEWESTLLGGHPYTGDMETIRDFLIRLYGPNQNRPRSRDGEPLPVEEFREHFGAAWAMLSDDSDIVFIPAIWFKPGVRAYTFIHPAFLLLRLNANLDSITIPYI